MILLGDDRDASCGIDDYLGIAETQERDQVTAPGRMIMAPSDSHEGGKEAVR